MTPLIALHVNIEGNFARGLYDPGANISMVNYNYIKKIKKDINIIKSYSCKTVGGVKTLMGLVLLKAKIFSIEKKMWFFVVQDSDFTYDILLGLDAIKAFRLCQDHNLNITQASLDTQKNETQKESTRVQVSDNLRSEDNNIHSVQVSDNLRSENNNIHEEWNDIIRVNWNEYMPVEQFHAQTEHLNENQRDNIHQLIDKYETLFAKNRYDVGTFCEQEAHIKLIENKFIAKKPYRCSLQDQEEIKKQVNELLKVELIEESCSPFAAPVTMAYRKADGEKNRMCIDFRDLNKLIVPETYPFPTIDDIVIKTQGCSWFTALDVNSAFWSIPIRMKDRYKTGFVTQEGHYQWKCLPFGIKIASPVYQRILSGIIRRNGLSHFCANYIDDILIFSKSFEEHLDHIERVFNAIRKEGFKIKFTKCSFATRQIKYLGHTIEQGKIKPLFDNLVAIKDFPIPRTKKNIRQFLGKVNFYYKYIKDAAKVLEPFHNLLRKNVDFVWSSECQKAFDQIKKYLISEPVLTIFDQNKPIRIYTDASLEGVGAVLKQPQPDGSEKPIAYFSKKLTEGQKKKKAVFLECLAIKEAVKYWQYWLMGNRFVVYSDHKPLENLNVNVRPDEELGDMMNYLSQFQFSIIYNPGTNNHEADSLSRNPVLDHNCETNKDIVRTVNLLKLSEIMEDQKTIVPATNNTEKNGVIYRNLRGRNKVVLTDVGCRKLVQRVHNELGHVGRNTIIATITPYYFANNIYKIIKSITSTCEICIKNKTRKGRNFGLLGHLGPAKAPFEIMSLDTIGGFGGRRSTKKYLHLLTDHFTRYAYILTSKTQKSEDFIKLIELVHSKNKIGTLLTDQYGGLSSEEFENYLERNNIDHVFTAVDSPFSNGLNERLNQTLVNRIRCRVNERREKRAWSAIARQCVEEYNKTFHSVTKFPPQYLLNGTVTPIMPIELQEKQNLSQDRIIAYENSVKNHAKNKARYDKNRKAETFKVGDYVYIENGNRLNREKLDEVRVGPFPIVNKLSDTVYQVRCRSSGREKRLYHISKMVPANYPAMDSNK